MLWEKILSFGSIHSFTKWFLTCSTRGAFHSVAGFPVVFILTSFILIWGLDFLNPGRRLTGRILTTETFELNSVETICLLLAPNGTTAPCMMTFWLSNKNKIFTTVLLQPKCVCACVKSVQTGLNQVWTLPHTNQTAPWLVWKHPNQTVSVWKHNGLSFTLSHANRKCSHASCCHPTGRHSGWRDLPTDTVWLTRRKQDLNCNWTQKQTIFKISVHNSVKCETKGPSGTREED